MMNDVLRIKPKGLRLNLRGIDISSNESDETLRDKPC